MGCLNTGSRLSRLEETLHTLHSIQLCRRNFWSHHDSIARTLNNQQFMAVPGLNRQAAWSKHLTSLSHPCSINSFNEVFHQLGSRFHGHGHVYVLYVYQRAAGEEQSFLD